VPQIRELAKGVRKTSKLRGTGLLWLFRIKVFTGFNCALFKPANIQVEGVPQIGEFTNGDRETSKLGETGLIWLF
jgi:hypothetical protein